MKYYIFTMPSHGKKKRRKETELFKKLDPVGKRWVRSMRKFMYALRVAIFDEDRLKGDEAFWKVVEHLERLEHVKVISSKRKRKGKQAEQIFHALEEPETRRIDLDDD